MRVGIPATVDRWLGEVAGARGAAPAILGIDQAPLTWEGLFIHVRAAAAVLKAGGVGRGDVVLIVLPDGPEVLTCILAAASVATAFPVSDHEAPERYESLVDDVGVKAIICAGGRRLSNALAELAQRRKLLLINAEPDKTAAGRCRMTARGALGAAREDGPPRLEDPAVLIATSGATAAPKIVSSSQASIFASIMHCAEWLGLTPEDRSLCLMPFSHLHSIVRSTLPALVSGGSVVCAPGLDRALVCSWIDQFRPSYITGSPSIFRILAQRAAELGWKPPEGTLRQLVTGSDRIDLPTIDAVSRALDVPVRQFYGLSEVAPLVAVTPTDGSSFPAGSVGKVNPVWSVACVDEGGRPVPPGSEGEIALLGGFLNAIVGRVPARQRFTPDGRFLTGDLGVLDADGFLVVTGRADDRIHTGGRKVDPRAIEELLLQHPAVATAVAFGIPDEVLGHRVGAAVVPKAGLSAAESDLQAFVAASAFSYMVPERIVVVSELPTGAAGKVARSDLARRLGLVASAPPASATPAVAQAPGSIEVRLADIVARRLKLANVDPNARFADLGGDSFAALDIIFEIEDAFGVNIPPAMFTANSSVAALALLVGGAAQEQPKLRLIRLNADGRFPPLFVPFTVEGYVGFAAPLAEVLGPEQPVYVFQEPRGPAEPAEYESLEVKATKLIDLMISVQPKGPYYLLGYSFGAHIALEIVRQLLERGERTAFFGILDDAADLAQRHFASEKSSPGSNTSSVNTMALHRYVPKPFPGKIVLFRASEPAYAYMSDPYAGWGEIALDGVEVHDVFGDHESIVTAGGMRWGATLSLTLAKARLEEHRRRSSKSASTRPPRKASAPLMSKYVIEARIAAKRGDRGAEIAAYRAALALDPNQPRWVHLNLAEALFEEGQSEGAAAELSRAIAGAAYPVHSMVTLARLRRSKTGPDSVQDLYELGRLMLANESGSLALFGHLALAAGKPAEAVESYRRSIALRLQEHNPASFLGNTLLDLAGALACLRRSEEAVEAAREAMKHSDAEKRWSLRDQFTVAMGSLAVSGAPLETLRTIAGVLDQAVKDVDARRAVLTAGPQS